MMARAGAGVVEDVQRIAEALAASDALISDEGIHDPKEQALEDEQVEESLHRDDKEGRLDALYERIEALERRARAAEGRSEQLQAEIDREREFAQKIAQKQGFELEWQQFQATAFMEDEAMKAEFARIKREQNGQAVIVVHHHTDAAQNRPIKGSINFQRFQVPRGVPCLTPVSVIEALYYMRRLTVERYLEGGDKKAMRFVHDRRAPFNILPPGTRASATAALRG